MVIGEAQAVESREPASPSASGRTPEHEVGDEMLSGGSRKGGGAEKGGREAEVHATGKTGTKRRS